VTISPGLDQTMETSRRASASRVERRARALHRTARPSWESL